MPRLHFGLSTPRLCLDFANTLEHRLTNHPREAFKSYGDLLSWSKQAEAVTSNLAQTLTLESERRPAEAAATVERAINLREVIYRIFSAAAGKRPQQTSDLELLNAVLGEALAALRVTPMADGFTWGWTPERRELDCVLWPVAQSAAELLTSADLRTVRECAASDCGWLFLDNSRNHSRRWCDMKACGNRAKARRHYERKKQAREEAGNGSAQP
jgi:predicted RNA-binding Zn ribbon-like protein